jgi:hypothetical protein
MTTNEVAVRDALADRIHYAKALAESSLLPEAYRKQPANVLLAVEMADALGIAPMQAINGISVIKGKPTMSAELMRALVLRAGHQLRVDVLTEQGCRVLAARKEWPDDVQAFEFTMADAQKAGLASSDTYKRHPKAMLLARATSLACRAVFPDVVAGMAYTPDEVAEHAPVRAVVTERLMPPAPEKPALEATEVPGVVVDEDGVMHYEDEPGDA